MKPFFFPFIEVRWALNRKSLVVMKKNGDTTGVALNTHITLAKRSRRSFPTGVSLLSCHRGAGAPDASLLSPVFLSSSFHPQPSNTPRSLTLGRSVDAALPSRCRVQAEFPFPVSCSSLDRPNCLAHTCSPLC